MKTVICAFLIALTLPGSSQAAWLLWKHSVVTRNLDGAPRSIAPQGTVDKWELLNALEERRECLSALRAEYKKSYDGLVAAYPNEPLSQSPLGDGVSASMSTGAQTSFGPSAKPMQLFYEYAFWCLPPGVDPRTTTITIEKK